MSRPKKEAPAFDPEVAKEFISRYFSVEREIKVLREDKKELKSEFKEKLDIKLISNMIRYIKAQLRLNVSDETKEELETLILDKINMIEG